MDQQHWLAAVYRSIRPTQQLALPILKSEHFEKGIAVTPVQLHYEYDKVWYHVVNCNRYQAEAITATCLAKYGHLSGKSEPMKIEKLDGYRLQRAAQRGTAIVGGLDSVHPKELHLMDAAL